MRKVWMYDPHVGGVKIKPAEQEAIRRRLLEHANKNYAGRFTRLEIRFHGALCYVDAFQEPEPPTKGLLKARGETKEQYYESMRNFPIHLCRLRYLGSYCGKKDWSLAFYTYSNERYEPCLFHDGSWEGTLEDGFDIGATYLI